MSLLVSDAYAQSAGGGLGGGGMGQIVILVVFVGVFYFLLIRPQQKRMKEQQAMLSRLVVVTTDTGGVRESIAPAMHRFCVRPGDPVALARAIQRVVALGEGEFAALGRFNRTFCVSRYDIRRTNPQLLASAMGGAINGATSTEYRNGISRHDLPPSRPRSHAPPVP